MDVSIQPGKLNGTVQIPASKSIAHRALICAAFADRQTEVICSGLSEDIEATVRALTALGAAFRHTERGLSVTPVLRGSQVGDEERSFDCGESGSTLRFILPLIGIDGVRTRIMMHGRLSERPLDVLLDVLREHGMAFEKEGSMLYASGKLSGGLYSIPGNISSQYISALLMTLPLLKERARIRLTTALSSASYVDLTTDVMNAFGAPVDSCKQEFGAAYDGKYRSPGAYCVEGDWSNAAFWLAAQRLGSSVTVAGVSHDSGQGDMAAGHLMDRILNRQNTEEQVSINVDTCPDLLPILAVTAAGARGRTVFTGAGRLRDKESDRLEATAGMLKGFKAACHTSGDTMTVEGEGGRLSGCTVDSCGDHRIAMSAAIASTLCETPVTVREAGSVSKSYPDFWKDFEALGGHITQLD